MNITLLYRINVTYVFSTQLDNMNVRTCRLKTVKQTTRTSPFHN